eukprot:TRINITY_DN1718_c0_g2_i1.p1 TRINITY_DN1718_c0_g2~~TRINITY_DN1718_c0_g2_i1.p1  ORF type:complete len:112 (+),score=15.80 TRINITY_DN1718_c0_g2_i1:200-535(+)
MGSKTKRSDFMMTDVTISLKIEGITAALFPMMSAFGKIFSNLTGILIQDCKNSFILRVPTTVVFKDMMIRDSIVSGRMIQLMQLPNADFFNVTTTETVSYTHLTLPTIYSV